jgi:SAM-dependent methyltransferase
LKPSLRERFIIPLLSVLKARGVKETLQIIDSTLRDKDIDRQFNIRSNDIHDVRAENQDKLVDSKSTFYQASRAEPLRKLLASLSWDRKKGFVDVGSGMGRVLALAAEYGFQSVTGVELFPELHNIAQENAQKLKVLFSKTEFRLINENILDYEIRPDEQIFYLYDPFDDATMIKFMQKLDLLANEASTIQGIYHHNLKENFRFLDDLKVTKYRKIYKFSGNQYYVFSNKPVI